MIKTQNGVNHLNKAFIIKIIYFFIINLVILTSFVPITSLNVDFVDNKRSLRSSNEEFWSYNETDVVNSITVTAPEKYQNYYAGQVNLTFSNVRKTRVLKPIENEFTGAAINLLYDNIMAMSFNLSVRTKIYGFKVLLYSAGVSVPDYTLSMYLYEANQSTGLPKNTPYWTQNKTIPSTDIYFGLHTLELTDEYGYSLPLTLGAGTWYLGLKHEYQVQGEYLFWGFFHDNATYQNDPNTDYVDEGTAMNYNVTGWHLIETHAQYGSLVQSDVTIDFVLFIDAEEYILPTSSFLTINSTLVEDWFIGYGEIRLKGPIHSRASNSYFFDLSTRFSIIFDVQIDFNFRNVVILLESMPSNIRAKDSIKISFQCVKYSSNEALSDVLISIYQNNTQIQTVTTDNTGKSEIVVTFSNEGAYLVSIVYEGDEIGNTKGQLDIEVRARPPPTAISSITYIAILMTILICCAIGVILWRLYFGDWKAPMPYQIYVLNDMGLSIFDRQYSEQEIDSQLISGFLTAISSFMAAITVEEEKGDLERKAQDNLKSVQKGHLTMQLEWGKYTAIACMIAFESYHIRRKLRKFQKYFEQQYKDDLEFYTGDIDVFRSAKPVLDKLILRKVQKVDTTNTKGTNSNNEEEKP
ncbi:MAG: hypothetical protein ACFFCQ_18635 [Promethearchaeota archaeon]